MLTEIFGTNTLTNGGENVSVFPLPMNFTMHSC